MFWKVVENPLDTVKVAWESVWGTRAWVVARDFDAGWGRAEEVGRLGQEYREIALFLLGGSWLGYLAWTVLRLGNMSVLAKTSFALAHVTRPCQG